MTDLLVSIFPIALLIYLMTRRKSVPSHHALPFVAGLMYVLKLTYFAAPLDEINATVVAGFLTAWTPILIVWGAIFLFRTMERSGAMAVIHTWLDSVTRNRVAQLMIVGWAFAFMIEGASGFGTPAALAAPILVGLGFPPVRVAILCLIMNSVPVSMGAVGTPTWFGFAELGLTQPEMLEVGFKSAIVHGAAALVIPIIALRFIVSGREVRKNWLFVFLSILTCVVPYIILSKFSYEFPAVVGGMIGLLSSVFLASKGIGLDGSAGESSPRDHTIAPPRGRLIRAMFPLWGTVAILIITRIPQIGLRGLLNATSPCWSRSFGTLGEIGITPSLVLSFEHILQTDVGWNMKMLFVPAIIPFFVISAVSFFVLKMNRKSVAAVWRDSASQIKHPMYALIGALIFVKLLMAGGENSCVMIIGKALADATGKHWQLASSYLGALGAFFAGSNTVSNLTFGGIQDTIARDTSLSLNRTTILAMQSVGGAMGNMVCINNIVAVCSVLGLTGKEGFIIKRTVIPVIIYGIIAAVISLML
ncbi:MAG: L-lactate permease [Phycisphaerae bacterium]|nr:L-lactate permease [Phycisphaerae bacterium]